MKQYTFLGRSDGVRFCIEGVDVFSCKWESLGECDIVLDPEDKTPYSFSRYRVTTSTRTIDFLAGKFRDDSWGFYREFRSDDPFSLF